MCGLTAALTPFGDGGVQTLGDGKGTLRISKGGEPVVECMPPSLEADYLWGMVQCLSLLVAYGYILFNASNMLSEGSELLLLVPSLAGLVGSIVLPILGAVPDGAIMLFSGLGDDAQRLGAHHGVGAASL